MIPSSIYKLKSQSYVNQNHIKNNIKPVQNHKRSESVSGRLTKGGKCYQEIKNAYNPTPEIRFKTDYTDTVCERKLSTKSQNSRSFKKFFKDQEQYQLNKETKINEFRAELAITEASKLTNCPEIDKMSKKICEWKNYEKEELVERLSKKKLIEQFEDCEELFSPKIEMRSKSLKRDENIYKILHSDAMRRKEKQDLIEAEKSVTPKTPKYKNGNTYRLVCNKMYGEFCELVPEDEVTLPVVMAWTVMSEMFGVELNPNKSEKEQEICEKMTSYLCLEGSENVERSKLWEFIEIIIKKQEAKPVSYGEQFKEIIEHFGSLYTCRMARPRSIKEADGPTFAPETLKVSEKKASKFREKILQSAKENLMGNENLKVKLTESIALEDIFQIENEMRKASHEKKKLAKIEQEMKKCTFKPKLSESYAKPVYLPPKYSITSKNIADSKKTFFKSIQDTSSINQSFLNQTLKPSASKISSNKDSFLIEQSHNKVPSEIKNMDKAIMRMAIARKDRELSNSMKNRGYPKNIKNWIEYTQNEKSDIVKEHSKMKGFTYKQITLN